MTMFATRQELFRVGRRAVAATPGIRLNPAVADIPGSDLNLVIGIDAVIGEEVTARGATAMRGAFVETARDDQLDRVAYDRYGLLRFTATPARVDLALSRPVPGVATPGTYSAGSVVQTADGLQFGLDEDAVFGDFDSTVQVAATCLQNGLDTNVAAGTITAFVTAPFDPTMTVGNAAAAAGGTDTETDVEFRGRIRGFFPTVAKATLPAIRYGATQVPGVAVASVSEVVNPGGLPAGLVQVVVGDRNGNSTAAMLAAVSDALLVYRASGIPAQVLGGTVFYQAVQWQLAFLTGFDEHLATERVRAVTVAVSQFLPPGPGNGVMYRSALLAAAKNVPGVVLDEDALVLPAGDVVPSTEQEMIRVLPTSVTFS